MSEVYIISSRVDDYDMEDHVLFYVDTEEEAKAAVIELRAQFLATSPLLDWLMRNVPIQDWSSEDRLALARSVAAKEDVQHNKPDRFHNVCFDYQSVTKKPPKEKKDERGEVR